MWHEMCCAVHEKRVKKGANMKVLEQGALRSAGECGKDAPIEERVAYMEARESIEELLPHYARCVDVQDAQGVGALFTEEGEMCNPGMPPVVGRARIAKLYGKLLPAMRTSSHAVGAQQVLFESADRAVVHAAFQSWDSYKADDALDCLSFGFYEVEAVREADGEWRIATLNISFAGQLEVPAAGCLCDGSGMNGRFCEQFARPWPPVPRE